MIAGGKGSAPCFIILGGEGAGGRRTCCGEEERLSMGVPHKGPGGGFHGKLSQGKKHCPVALSLVKERAQVTPPVGDNKGQTRAGGGPKRGESW